MRRITALVLFVALAAAPSATALAAEDDSLPNVTFHTEYLGEKERPFLRAGVEAAWEVLRPYAAKHGLTEFPRSDIWGFSYTKDAAKYSGLDWGGLSGYAVPGRAYVVLRPNNRMPKRNYIPLVAHEATHLVQFDITGSNFGSYCLMEGAAKWYQYKAREYVGSESLKSRMNILRDLDPEDLPAFRELTTQRQFRRASNSGARVYFLCTLAFDMLIETGGGEEAYFNYLAELRRTDWKTAFNRAFSEDLASFEKRFAMYRENGFEDYRFPEEIARDIARAEFLYYISSCAIRPIRSSPCPI